jgi:hypothetical protein
MRTKNKMITSLLIISALFATLVPVFAAPTQLAAGDTYSIQAVEAKPVQVKSLTAIQAPSDISEYDASKVDNRIQEAENAAPIEEDVESPLWYLNALGYITNDEPDTDSVETRGRIKLQMIAEKVKVTSLGALYKVHWGRVTHDSEQYSVTGWALLDSDGVFYLKLDGEAGFKAIGQIHGAWFGVRVSMKGYLVEDEISTSHVMHGWAIPLSQRLIYRLRNHLQ